jgi:hypothetical protein
MASLQDLFSFFSGQGQEKPAQEVRPMYGSGELVSGAGGRQRNANMRMSGGGGGGSRSPEMNAGGGQVLQSLLNGNLGQISPNTLLSLISAYSNAARNPYGLSSIDEIGRKRDAISRSMEKDQTNIAEDREMQKKVANAQLRQARGPRQSGSAALGGMDQMGGYGQRQTEDSDRRRMQREMEAARERELATQQRYSRDDMKFKLGLLSEFMKPSNERDVTYKETQQIVNNAGRYDKVPVTERIDAPAEDYRRQLIQLILGSQ